MAQWTRRLTTNQEIPGSTPGTIKILHVGVSGVQILFCRAKVGRIFSFDGHEMISLKFAFLPSKLSHDLHLCMNIITCAQLFANPLQNMKLFCCA